MGEEVVGFSEIWGKETVIRVYCMKNIYFQLKKERKGKNE